MASPHRNRQGSFRTQLAKCGTDLNRLIAGFIAPAFADTLGERLGVPRLPDFPVLVTICTRLNKRHGTIHTDSRSMIASALLYLNEDWMTSDSAASPPPPRALAACDCSPESTTLNPC